MSSNPRDVDLLIDSLLADPPVDRSEFKTTDRFIETLIGDRPVGSESIPSSHGRRRS